MLSPKRLALATSEGDSSSAAPSAPPSASRPAPRSSSQAGGASPSDAPLPPHDAGPEVHCVHADRCGGCPLLGMRYGAQLAQKKARVTDAVGRYPGLGGLDVEDVREADPITGYRTRAKLIVASGGRIGLFAKGGGHHVVDIPSCRVLSPALAEVADRLRARVAADEATSGPLTPFDPTGRGALRAIDLREVRDDEDADPRVLVTFVVQRSRAMDLDALRAAARALMAEAPNILGVAANFHEGDAPQILGNETTVLAGVASARDRVGRSQHLATFGSFVQAHRGQAGRVHGLLARALGLDEEGARGSEARPRVLDLYGGSGAIALGLAARGASVHLVESFPPAVAQAKAAAEAQSLPLSTDCADVATAVRNLLEAKAKFDAAVMNPPRRGVSASAREWVARLGADTLVYVSCDPDTLARDLDHFARLGYAADALTPLDMIPLTEEVETVVVLRKAPIPTPRVMYEDDEILVVEKAAHEPTTPQGEYPGSLLARARRIPGAEAAVPVHRLDIGTSGLVMLARSTSVVAKWAGVLAAASTRKIYVAGARGVTPSKGAITRELREDGRLYPARTRYRRLAVASGHSVLRVIPEQGRTHQIRRHLAAIGHPILGDERYGHAPTNRFFEEKNGLDRAFLHCVRIELEHPTTGQRLIIEAPLPGDLRSVLERTSGAATVRFLEHKNALGGAGTSVSSVPPPPDSRPASTRVPAAPRSPSLVAADEVPDSG